MAVDGFPYLKLQPYRPGELLDEPVLADERLRLWVGYEQDRPVCAGSLFVEAGLACFSLGVGPAVGQAPRLLGRHGRGAPGRGARPARRRGVQRHSRPSAEALGFLPITRFTLWHRPGRLLLDQLGLHLQADVPAQQEPARLQGGVPDKAPVLPVDLGHHAEKPIRWLPQGSVPAPRNSTSTVTGRVVPLMVRSPSTFHRFSPSPGRTPVLRKLIVGWSHAEEVVGAHVGVAGLVLGVDRVGVDLDLEGGVLGPLGHGGGAAGARAGHAPWPSGGCDELERLVGRVDLPGADVGHQAAVDDARAGGGGTPRSCWSPPWGTDDSEATLPATTASEP